MLRWNITQKRDDRIDSVLILHRLLAQSVQFEELIEYCSALSVIVIETC